MLGTVPRLRQRVREWNLRRRLLRTGVTPVVLTGRDWRLRTAGIRPMGLDLTYAGPGGTWRLWLARPDRESPLDATAPGLTEVTVVFPDGCTVRCLGDGSDRFVPLPPHSASVAAVLPPMAHVPAAELVRLAGGRLEVGRAGSHVRRRRRGTRPHAA